MLRKITTQEKKKATNDWLELFPDYSVYKDMWIIKKIDCMVFGICLESGGMSSDYKPLFHITNLIEKIPVLTFELNYNLLSKNGSIDYVSILNHDNYYKSAAERLVIQNPIMEKEDITYEDLATLYKDKIIKKNGSHPGVLIESFIRIMGYYKKDKNEILETYNWFEIKMKEDTERNFLWRGEHTFEKIKEKVSSFVATMDLFDYQQAIYNSIKVNKIIV